MQEQRKVFCICLAVILFGGFYLLANRGSKNTECTGEKRMENGVEIISNPDSPQYGQVRLDLQEIAAIAFGENNQDLFSRIEKIVVAKDNSFFALESDKCAVYHFDKNGAFINKFGRKGAGPGEFKRPSDLYCDDKGNIYVLDGTVISVFNSQGEHKKQIKLPKFTYEIFVVPNGGFSTSRTDYSEKGIEDVVEKYDERIKKETELFRFFREKITQRRMGKRFVSFHVDHAYQPRLVCEKTIAGRCIFAYSLEYALNVIGQSGKVIKRILKAEKPKKISEKEKEAIYNLFAPKNEKNWTKPVLQEALQYPAHRPFFNRILADDQGRIFVFKVGSVLDGEKSGNIHADLFNREGCFVQEVLMPFVPNFIKEGILYRVNEDDESGEVAIKLYQVRNWQQLKNS